MITINDPIKHKTQKSIMSCIPTCLAMLLDKDPEQVYDEFTKDYIHGFTDVSTYLHKHGVFAQPHITAGMHQIRPGRLYLATVPSLQLPGLFHQIIIDARFGDVKVYDPCKGLQGKQYYSYDHVAEGNDLAYPLRSFLIDYEIILPE